MVKHRAVRLLMALLVFVAPAAQAFIDPPWITPATPRAGDVVSINIRLGICDAIGERPGYPQVTQEGSAIRIVEYGAHWENDELCGFGVGTVTDSVGSFPPGDYELTVDLAYVDELGFPHILAVGTVPFSVIGIAPVTSIPTINFSGQLVLTLFIAGLAICVFRARRQT